MEFFNDHPLEADKLDGTVDEQGSWFVLYRCQGIIEVVFTLMNGDKKIVDMKSKRGGQVEPFKAIRFISPIVQDIDFGISDLPIFDNDVGAVDVDGIISVVANGGKTRVLSKVALVANTAKEILVTDLDRLKTAIFPDQNIYIGTDNTVDAATGYPVSSGSDWVDENTSSLWAFSASAASLIMIQDKK